MPVLCLWQELAACVGEGLAGTNIFLVGMMGR